MNNVCRNLVGVAAVAAAVAAGCVGADDGASQGAAEARAEASLPRLDPDLGGWLPQNRARLNALIAARGRESAAYDPRHRPVAIFDWDNTMMKNDIGDATFFWMLNNDKMLQPPARDWSRTSSALTAEARRALNDACDALTEPGQPLPTSANAACADAFYRIYVDGSVGGRPAWVNPITSTMNRPYAWVAHLLAGYTEGQARSFAAAAYAQNSAAPIGATQTVGSIAGVTGYVRIYDQMRDLVGVMQRAGFDVWVVSASPQLVVEPVAREVGVPSNHVIGIRSVFERGHATYDLQGCGTVPDGANSVITFDRGKRCWINREVFGVAPEHQMERQPEALRPVFGAGDSDTDLAFMQDATDLKLVINRAKLQLLCNASQNLGGRWLVQPMFIAPRAPRTAPYACLGAPDNDGNLAVDEAGNPFTMNYSEPPFTLPLPGPSQQ